MEAIEILLIQIAVILLLSRLLGAGMRLIHQPQVIGEMIAGIMLGPSLLGLVHHGAWMRALFPAALMGHLNALSQLGVMLFMFLVGLELDPKLLSGQGKAALATGTVGIVIPFISGAALALRSALKTLILAVGYVVVMLFIVRKLLGRLQAHYHVRGYLSQNLLAVVFLLLLASSLATDVIGIHQVFGAFMFGAVMPKDSRFIKHLSEKMEDFTVLFLLPLFFAYTGVQTKLGLLDSASLWAICGGIIAVAVIGKFGGVTLAARWYGMGWRRSSLLGVLMNTRGLMELIILNIGLSFHVLSPKLFAMMVVMALFTTFMTTPLMRLLYSPARQRKELEEAQREEAERTAGVNVVVPVSLSSSAGALVRMGGMLMAGDPGRIYALHLERPDEVESRAKSVLIETDEVLEVAQSAAESAHLPIHAISFVSRNIGRDIADAARDHHASWVVMGWHKPVFFNSVLGSTVAQVVRQAPANIAILVDKGLGEVARIVIPYLGEAQDRGALLAAERLGRLPGVRVTILHVVKPNRGDAEARLAVQSAVDKEFPGTASHGGVRVQVVESDRPIELVVEESRRYDLMILGLADQWNLQNVSIFGKHETVAERAHCSLLIVHASPLAPAFKSDTAAQMSNATAAEAAAV